MAEIEGGRRVEMPEVERVRTFVKFEKQESAVRVRMRIRTHIRYLIVMLLCMVLLQAYRDLNGRFFGGRQISASFFDEDKFDRMDLIPTGGEW